MKTIIADEKTKIDSVFLDKENPQRIVNSCRGRDHIDYEECARRGIEVVEADYSPEESVADHAVAMLLWLTSLGPKQAGCVGEETAGKKALIIGAGRIGQAIHSRLYGFGIETRYYDPYAALPEQVEGLTPTGMFMELKVGLEWCDYTFLACPLTTENKGMLSYQEFLALKNKVLVNIARSELADSYYLAMAVNEWRLRVGWDFADELNASDWKAWETLLRASARGRAIMTKHNAWHTKEALERRENTVKEAMKGWCWE